MLEDFWLPRREGSKGTEISTLEGARNLGELEDVKYFQSKLYRSLNVPIGRLEPQQGFSLGRTTEITRDELKFTKFIQRLRNKFSILFDDLLRVQLVLKKVCTEEEWREFKEDIFYDFKKDNNFDELKEAELLSTRLDVLTKLDPFVGKYYSIEWVRKNVLQQSDEDMEEINGQMEQENAVMAQQQQQQIEQQAQIAQAQIQQAQIQHEQDMAHEDYQNELDRINKKEIALIAAESKAGPLSDTDESGTPDVLEIEKLAAERDNASREYQMKTQDAMTKNRLAAEKLQLEKEKLQVARENQANDLAVAKENAKGRAKPKTK